MLFYEAANNCFLVFLNPNHKSTFNQTSFQKQKVIPQLLHTLHKRIKTIFKNHFQSKRETGEGQRVNPKRGRFPGTE